MALASSRRTQRQRSAPPRKGDLREGAILDAAERLLAGTPFTELTIDDIAREAGLSRSSLYFYFESKHAVLAALLERLHVVAMQPLDDDQAPARTVIEGVVRNWRKHGPALRTFFEVAMVAPDFGAQWRRGIDEGIELIARRIEEGRAAGTLAPGPPAPALAGALVWMVQHSVYELFRRRHRRADERELIDTLTAAWQRAIGAEPAR